MSSEINPISKAFISFYEEIKKFASIDKLKSTDLQALDKSMAELPTKWSFLNLRERARIIRDSDYFTLDLQNRIQIIKGAAETGFRDIQSALQNDRHNFLINPALLESVIDNPDLTVGEKRAQVVQVFNSEFKNLREDPFINSRLQAIDPQYRRDLLQIKQEFINAKTPEEKAQVLTKIKEAAKPLKQKMDEIREKLSPDSKSNSQQSTQDLMASFTDLCLVSMDDPEFIHAVLFEIAYSSFPPQPLRLALISLICQSDEQKTEMNPTFSKVEESIKGYDFKSIPRELPNWYELIEKNADPALRSLGPSLKNLSERLTKHTNVSASEYFKAVFSSKKRVEIDERKELSKCIPKINLLSEAIKKRMPQRAHFKNIKRVCREMENNPKLPALRLKYRKELGVDIPLNELDMALSQLNAGSSAYIPHLIHNYEIKNEEALYKLLVIRLAHHPILAAKFALYSDELNLDLKNTLKKLAQARLEVWSSLMLNE